MACSLQMESLVDFGSVLANSQVISKEVSLTNQGSAPGLLVSSFHKAVCNLGSQVAERLGNRASNQRAAGLTPGRQK